jgi:THO complex subunit 1
MDDVPAAADEKSNSASNPGEPEGTSKPKSMTADELYPTFWSLQKSFAYPPRVCEQSVLEDFKKGFESTLAKFKDVPKVIQGTSGDSPRGTKRKSDEMEHDEFASSFNPKYLTSRELFQLEVRFNSVVGERTNQLICLLQLSDLAFQRHILVQALILLDFLLSLTEKAKKRLANRKVNFTLSDQDVSSALIRCTDNLAKLACRQNGPPR